MATHTFTFTSNGETVTVKHTVSDEFLFGMGFGLYIYNLEKGLPENYETIKVDGLNLVENYKGIPMVKAGARMSPNWTIEDEDAEAEESDRYLIKYRNRYSTFQDAEFIQGAHTVFLWLNAPELKVFTSEIVDTYLVAIDLLDKSILLFLMNKLETLLPELICYIADFYPSTILSLLGVSNTMRFSLLPNISNYLPLTKEFKLLVLKDAISFDNPDLFNYIENIDITFDPEEYSIYAASIGALDFLKLILKTRFYLSKNLCDPAAVNGHVEILQWLCENNDTLVKNRCVSVAAKCGQLGVLKWAKDNNCYWDEHTFELAAKGGHLEVLKWLQANGCLWNSDTCARAAEYGHLEVLQWLRANRCPWTKYTFSLAAKGGHLKVLQWLYDHECPWGTSTCAYAAWGGYLEVLKWARENGCDWDSTTCIYAAKGGHLEVLQWARSNGCDWNRDTCNAAAKEGHLEVLIWLRSNGCPWDKYICRAAQNKQLHILQWIQANGCLCGGKYH